MPHLQRGILALAVLSLAFAAGACNKGPAEAALKLADQALAAAKPDLERYAPEELTALTNAASEAHANFEKGNYTDALKAAQGMPAKIQAAAAAAGKKKDELVDAWTRLSGEMPGLVQGLTAKVTELGAAKKLPKGMDAVTLANAQGSLASITEAWGLATAAFQGGDVPRALKLAQDVETKATALAGVVGLAPPQPPQTASVN
jgi:hypothetical protein